MKTNRDPRCGEAESSCYHVRPGPINAGSQTSLEFLCFKKILFIFREREKEGEKEGEKHQCVVASHVPPTGDLAHNPGMCPD